MVAYTFNCSPGEAEAGRFLVLEASLFYIESFRLVRAV